VTWESFYLFCFVAGLTLTIVSLAFGAHFHLPIHVHIPHGLHLPHVSVHQGGSESISPLNLATLMMFLTWFGGTGYLLTHYHSAAATLALLIALIVGYAGGSFMYLFMARVLIANERPLRAADFDMHGVLGHVSVPIRSGDGTGELIYSQQGTRRSCGARSEDGRAIERGTEVVVMRYENGIAYVKPWAELASESL
jgi:membrane protein implicated in regulation of membrane protease activity